MITKKKFLEVCGVIDNYMFNFDIYLTYSIVWRIDDIRIANKKLLLKEIYYT